MSKMIMVQYHPNPNCCTLHLECEISDSRYQRFDRPLRPESEDYLKQLGTIGEGIVRALFAIPGVSDVSIKPYEVHFTKGAAFERSPIVTAAIDVIKKTLLIADSQLEFSVDDPHASQPKQEAGAESCPNDSSAEDEIEQRRRMN